MNKWIERQEGGLKRGQFSEVRGQVSALPAPSESHAKTEEQHEAHEEELQAKESLNELHPLFNRTWFGFAGRHRIDLEGIIPEQTETPQASRKEIRSLHGSGIPLKSQPNIFRVWSSDGLPWEPPVPSESE